jgi:hypothetical protein
MGSEHDAAGATFLDNHVLGFAIGIFLKASPAISFDLENFAISRLN